MKLVFGESGVLHAGRTGVIAMLPAGTELLLRDRRATLTSPSHQRRCDVRTPLPSHPPIRFICRMQIKLLAQKKKKNQPLMCWDDSRVHPQFFFFFLSFLFPFYFCTLCLSCFFGGGLLTLLSSHRKKTEPRKPHTSTTSSTSTAPQCLEGNVRTSHRVFKRSD